MLDKNLLDTHPPIWVWRAPDPSGWTPRMLKPDRNCQVNWQLLTNNKKNIDRIVNIDIRSSISFSQTRNIVIPRVSDPATARCIQGTRFHTMTSRPVKWSSRMIGQRKMTFNRPTRVKKNETWPYDASPNIRLNDTCTNASGHDCTNRDVFLW